MMNLKIQLMKEEVLLMKKIKFNMTVEETINLHDSVMAVIDDATIPDKFIDFKCSFAMHAIEHIIERLPSEDSFDVFMKCAEFMKFETIETSPTFMNEYDVADIYDTLSYLYKFRIFIRRLIKYCDDSEFVSKRMSNHEKIKCTITNNAFMNIFHYGRLVIKFANFNLRNAKRKRTLDEVDDNGRKVFNKYNELVDVLDRDVIETEKIFNEFSGGRYWRYGKAE